MQKTGGIQKMITTIKGGNAIYQLPIGNEIVAMNELVGQQITLKFNGKIVCSNCGVVTRKSYSQGFCYLCCQDLARCDLCIIKPETCHHHFGTCREPQWGLDNCFTPHIIYLANSSDVKVGITRKINTPSRWIDQGAVSYLPILKVDTRLKSGQIEMALKDFVADKTNWRKMLKNEIEYVDLISVRDKLLLKIQAHINKLNAIKLDNNVLTIRYPVIQYPYKIFSHNFDKNTNITGILQGIKGQYLLLDSGVFNVRKFSSYNITLTY